MCRIHFLTLFLCFVYTLGQDEETTPTPATIEETGSTIEITTAGSGFMPQLKIVGGEIVEHREEFPYQASIRYKSQNYPFCGGTIISPTHILTASHCLVTDKGAVISKSTIHVVVGDLKTDSPTENTLSRDVLEVIIHELYSTVTLQNDIAILKISSLGTFNLFVNSIELSSETPKDGVNCVVSGWGTTSAGGSASIVLRSVEVPIASLEGCTAKYSNQVYAGMLCAGYVEGQRDACQGDSGGPLVCDDKLAGVVSWGYSCAQPDYPGIYTDVSQYRDWIAKTQGLIGDVSDDAKSISINEYIVKNRNEFPYQASLRFSTPNYHFCGATIIDSKHVLTAAHCVIDANNETVSPDSLSITVGDLNVREESDTTMYRNVLEIYVHENYSPANWENDIAVLRVSEFDEWTTSINMVGLATGAPAVGSRCTVSGWGAVVANGNYSDVLRYDVVPVLARNVCTLYYHEYIKDGMICAGFINGNRSSCEEDSGGPLICDNNLAGVVSWGYNCTVPGYPSVYTSIADYSYWIEDQVRKSSATSCTPGLFTMIFILVFCSWHLFV